MREWFVPVLGLWHIYVMAQASLWRACSDWLFASLFHHLFPTSKFNPKPTHKFITLIFSLIRLSWPSIKDNVTEAFTAAVDPLSIIILNNIQLVCSYFIPKV